MISGLRRHIQIIIAPERIPFVLEKIDEHFLQFINADGNARQPWRKIHSYADSLCREAWVEQIGGGTYDFTVGKQLRISSTLLEKSEHRSSRPIDPIQLTHDQIQLFRGLRSVSHSLF